MAEPDEMPNLLIVNSSARRTRSHTRELASIFEEGFAKAVPNVTVVRRDLAASPVPQVDEPWIAAAFTPPDERNAEMRRVLALSDTLIDEVEQADVIVIATPMYNYNVPASLKAWIDMVARIGKTFSFDLARGDYPIEPMLSGKRLVVLSSSGEFGFAPGAPRAHLNALDVALRACAHYLGASARDTYRVRIEYQEFHDSRWERSVSDAQKQTSDLARDLALGTRPAPEDA